MSEKVGKYAENDFLLIHYTSQVAYLFLGTTVVGDHPHLAYD